MACELNSSAVQFVYGYVYGEIADRISGKNKTPIDIKALMKKFYNELNSMPNEGFESEEDKKEKALYFAQAIPQIFGLVAARPKARDYILKTNTQLFIDIPTLANEFSDIKKVQELVKPRIKTIKKAKEEIENSINDSKRTDPETSKGQGPYPVSENNFSYAEKSARVVYPNGTTGQEAVPIDPESGKPRNIKDPEKALFYEVIKDIVYIIKRNSDTDQVLYGVDNPMELTLTLKRVRDVDLDLFTSKDRTNIEKYGATGIVSVITDVNGDDVYFNPDGSINMDGTGGRRIYQWIRTPYVENGKLFFKNVYGQKTSLVPASEVAQSWKKNEEAQGKVISDEVLYAKQAEIGQEQTRLFNQLLSLRNYIDETGNSVTVKITDGSFGLANDNKKFVPLSETGLNKEDIELDEIQTGENKGRYSIKIVTERPGVTVDQQLLLQRPNISDELAGKIATILTTKATLNGVELTPKERQDYFESYINNAPIKGTYISADGILVKTKIVDNKKILEVSINEEIIPQDQLYTPEAREKIYKHLQTARTDESISDKKYSAALNYNKDLMGKSIIDYDVNEETNKIEVNEIDYFEFIKEIALIEYPKDVTGYFLGMNAYLRFEIPQQILPEQVNWYELGIPAPKTDKKKDTGKKTAKKASVKTFSSWGEAIKKFNSKEGTWSMRPTPGIFVDFRQHFGNPWDTQKRKLDKNVIIVDNTQTAVKNYEDWLTGKAHKNIEPNRRKWILNMIDKGYVDNVTFIYYRSSQTPAYRSHADVLVDLINNRNQKTDADITIVEPIEKPQPQSKSKEENISNFEVKQSITNRLNAKQKPFLPRSVELNSFLDRIFTTKKAKDKALNWWNNSFLSQVKIDDKDKVRLLEKLTEVANSDAIATFENASITLWKGSSNIDIYHEAWHAFSQLFLTLEEQESLYEELLKVPKWANKNYATKEEAYFNIEEDIAEDFRSFMKSETFKASLPKFLRTIFEKIAAFLRWAYGGITRKDMTRPRDIPRVREMFDALRTNKPEEAIKKGLFQSLNASTQNLRFTKLNRGDRNIQPVKANKNIYEFTAQESMTIANAMDHLMALQFQNYNLQYGTTTGYLRTTVNKSNRATAYDNIKAIFEDELEINLENLNSLKEKNKAALEEGNENVVAIAEELKLQNVVDLLQKVIDNYGDIALSLNQQQKTGIVAYHMKKSRFSALKESYSIIEDSTSIEESKAFKDKEGNKYSSKEIASEETLMLLSSVFKILRDEKGNVIRDENGMLQYKKDVFGFPELESVDRMWSRLAKILEGSFDIDEMYQRILNNVENYPEFEQLMNLLPQLATREIENGGYKNPLEYKTETNFWQDLKKPRITYIQLNIDKEGPGQYQAKMAKASMDVYAVESTWETNFVLSDPRANKYIEKDGDQNNILKINPKTGALVLAEKFGKKTFLNSSEAIEFLKAIGIELDLTSSAIRNVVYNRKFNFANKFGIDRMVDIIKIVSEKPNSPDKYDFMSNPYLYLKNGLPESLREERGESLDVRTRLRFLAELQNTFSDGFSNFSVLNSERNRVWEHFLDNTITRVITSINKAESYQELTTSPLFKHMHWLAKENNPLVSFSQLMNSIFYMQYNPKQPQLYGKRRKNAKLLLQNVSGTQVIAKKRDETQGTNTASMDAVSKFLQEYHSMLLMGIEEFMRHASKNMAMGLTVDSETSINTYPLKKSKNLYIDINDFVSGERGELEGAKILTGYLSGEANRIFRFKSDKEKFKNYAGYNRRVNDKLGNKVYAGEAFTLFDDILKSDVQEDIYEIINEAVKNKEVNFNMQNIINENPGLRERIEQNISEYFNLQTKQNLKRLNENKFVDKNLISEIKTDAKLSVDDKINVLTKAYTYNSFIHKYETIILAYGDLAQYNHAKEEFHKRNAGLGSGGKGFRADRLAIGFVNDKSKLPNYYLNKVNESRGEEDKIKPRKYDGTFKTAILEELELTSKYYDEYLKELTKTYTERYGNPTKAKEIAVKVLKDYQDMKVADGQGYITFEAYRLFKWLEGNWTDQQEELYKKVSNGENISIEDTIQFFPPYKLQYFGNIESTGLPVTSFHKFSLAPLIPGVAKEGSELYNLHIKMMEQQMDYVTFNSGSKVGHIGKGDKVFNADGSFNEDVTFTPNIIYAEYLKNQTEINSSYKEVTIFSTQLRKMILEGFYENGEIISKSNKKQTKEKIDKYVSLVEYLTNIHKTQLLNEIGYKEVDNKFVPTSNASTEKIAKIIRDNLEKEDLFNDDLIDFIDVFESDGTLINDLSFHPESSKIEKLLLSILNKKVIKQKVKGEALVQVSSAFFNNYSELPSGLSFKTKAERDAITKKYAGTNFLPFYHQNKDGSIAAMKVMVGMQGDYIKLFNLEYDNNETVGVYLEDGTLDMDESLNRLNEKIKDDSWLDANNQANRKAISLVGVRIPVQGFGQIEAMEIYHFVPPQAGNIVIPPAEIVAKSGADFDIDKMTIFMSHLNEDGNLKSAQNNNYKDFIASYNKLKEKSDQGELNMFFSQEMAGVENELISIMKDIILLPDNFSSLITPNSTYLLKPIADRLAEYVMDYDPYANMMTDPNVDVDDKTKKIISPTRVLENLYNIYKHESNIVGKNTLGLGAIENTFNVIFNSLGAYMPNSYYHSLEKKPRTTNLWLRHNKINVSDKPHISLSNIFDINKEVKIADVISQLMNGWVDVEKDPWIFFIQGNYETAPTLMYLIKAGVPINEAIYFVSNPLVREYIKEKQLAKSTYSEILNKDSEKKSLIDLDAASRIISKYFNSSELKEKSNTTQRYLKTVELSEKYLSDREEKVFEEKEMLDLIKNYKINNGKLSAKEADLAKAMFLHYVEIEQQMTGITSLKLSSNPDTSTKSTISEIELSEAGINELYNDSKIPTDLIDKMKNDSIISSFFNGPLALSVIRPLFKLKYNDKISNYIIERSRILRNVSNKMLGERKFETFINMFRNDIISMVFQNAIRRYKLGNTYMSYEIKKEIPTGTAVDLKSRGAFVKENKDGTKFLYIDEKTLREEFESGAYQRGSDEQNSYENRNMYPLDPRTFLNNSELNFQEYLRFVAEREFLRSEYPMDEMINKSWFKAEGKDLYEANPNVSGGIIARFIYERYITNKALDNVYNIYHLFIDKENSLGSRYVKFLIEHKDNLLNEYDILNVLKLDTDKNKTIFNIYLADKDMTASKANVYNLNLKNLADKSVLKVVDQDENDRISDMFALMSNFAFLQTGLNKTKLNFTNVVDFNSFLDIMKEESEVFVNALDSSDQGAEYILDKFFKTFMKVNSPANINRGRFKDYLIDLDFASYIDERIIGTNIEDLAEDVKTPYTLEELDSTSSIYQYNDQLGNDEFYKGLVAENTDVVFIRNNVNESYKDSKRNFGGQQNLDKHANNMTMNITTSLGKTGDNFQNLPKEYYKDLITLWESEIANIVNINNRTNKLTPIAFPNTGFGDPALMPQELFVYLSKRLFDEFGYINPGSAMYNEMQKRTEVAEGITDQEILDQLGLEEDPFNC